MVAAVKGNRRVRRALDRRGLLGFKGKTKRGDGFGTEVSSLVKPELGARVRVLHTVDGAGQWSFDYPPAIARQLARDLDEAADYAEREQARIAGDVVPERRRRRETMTVPKGDRR